MTIPLLKGIKTEILNPLIYLLFSAALIIFLFGVFEVLKSGDSEEIKTRGKDHLLWGVLGMAIMVGAFGIINLICRTISCN